VKKAESNMTVAETVLFLPLLTHFYVTPFSQGEIDSHNDVSAVKSAPLMFPNEI